MSAGAPITPPNFYVSVFVQVGDSCLLFPPISTSSPGTSLKFRDFSFVSNGLAELLLSAGVSRK
nr:MAG TPA: hypothetical protein [Caudoviricetes sp.]